MNQKKRYVLNFEVVAPHKYRLLEQIEYFSERYEKWVVVEVGFVSDGATGAADLTTRAWWLHDKVCVTKKFADGSRCNRWQGSMILSDTLWEDGYRPQAILWFVPTLLGGLF